MTEYTAIAALPCATADDVEREIAHQWFLLQTHEPTQLLALSEGVSVAEIKALGTDPPFAAKPVDGGNRSDVVTMILIQIAIKVGTDVGKAALDRLWLKLIKPQVEAKFGKLQPPVDTEE